MFLNPLQDPTTFMSSLSKGSIKSPQENYKFQVSKTSHDNKFNVI